MARPRKYASAAERQAACRARKAGQDAPSTDLNEPLRAERVVVSSPPPVPTSSLRKAELS